MLLFYVMLLDHGIMTIFTKAVHITWAAPPKIPARQRTRTATPSTQYFMLSIQGGGSWLTSPSPLEKIFTHHKKKLFSKIEKFLCLTSVDTVQAQKLLNLCSRLKG